MATANGRFEGVLVRGMRPEDIRSNNTINGNVRRGRHPKRSRRAAARSPSAHGSPRISALYPGGQITLWNPEGRSTVVGTVPREVTYTVGAVFEIGVYDYDKTFVMLPMQDAQELLLMGDQVGIVEVQTSDPDKFDQILAPLRKLVQGEAVVHRLAADEFGPVPSAGGRARRDVRGAVAHRPCRRLQYPSSLIMLVRAKTRDIAILRTMGASRRGMMRVFMTVGVTIGSLGIVLGIILGALFLYFRQDVVDGHPNRYRRRTCGIRGSDANRITVASRSRSKSPPSF